LIREVLQQVMEAEMEDVLGAERGERTSNRQGYRSGYYGGHSSAVLRQKREDLSRAARKREIDVMVVWRLDRWGRSLVALVSALQELSSLKVGFVSLTEAPDLTTPSG
jgi:DNA invertase Pin-like site-specific DNA recombinase